MSFEPLSLDPDSLDLVSFDPGSLDPMSENPQFLTKFTWLTYAKGLFYEKRKTRCIKFSLKLSNWKKGSSRFLGYENTATTEGRTDTFYDDDDYYSSYGGHNT